MRTAEPFLWCAAPSRLIAKEVEVRLYAEHLRVYHGVCRRGIEPSPEPSTKFVTLAMSIRQNTDQGLTRTAQSGPTLLKANTMAYRKRGIRYVVFRAPMTCSEILDS